MRISIENQCAEIALRLLLSQNPEYSISRDFSKQIRWDVFFKVAKENRIMVRIFERLTALGVQPDKHFSYRVTNERERITLALDLMNRIGRLYEDEGIPYVFMKNFQHYPDMGDDIDLFVMERSSSAFPDSLIKAKFDGKAFNRTFLHRLAGKTQYRIQGFPCELEIHHGRMGPMGDQTAFAHFLVNNRRLVFIGDSEIFVPAPEDQFIMQLIQRVYGRFFIRISELVYAVNALFDQDFDWEYVSKTARSLGICAGLRYYLSNIEKIYRNVVDSSFNVRTLGKLQINLKPYPADQLKFREVFYYLPLRTAIGRLYPEKILSDVFAFRWNSVGRATLLPFVGALLVCKKMFMRWT